MATKLSVLRGHVVNQDGSVISNAEVEVRRHSDGGLASLYSTRTGTGGLLNPYETDTNGLFEFFLVAGAYEVTVTAPGFEAVYPYVAVGTAGEYDASDLLFAYVVTFALTGRPVNSEQMPPHVLPLAVTFPEDFAGSYASLQTATTAEKVVSITRNGSTIGTITFAAAATVGVFDMAAEVACAVGDKIGLTFPASADTTLAGVSVSLLGVR